MKITEERIDAADQSLGRVASRAAFYLRGKSRPDFDPRKLSAVRVVIEHARLIRFSGKKLNRKKHYRFSGYPGGLKTTHLKSSFGRSPQGVVRSAVAHMLPHNRLRSRILKRLTVRD